MTRTTLFIAALLATTGCGESNPVRPSPITPTPVVLTPPPPIDVRPVDPRFDDRLWQQLVFGQFTPGEWSRDRVWVLDASVMHLYIATTTDTGQRTLFGGGLEQMIEEAPAYGRALSGRSIIGQVRTGSYQEVASHRARNEPGWIYVVPVTDLPGTRCGQALIGANPGFIELNANNRDCLDLEIFAHEIGHALGFFHVDPAVYPHAVMKPSRLAGGQWPVSVHGAGEVPRAPGLSGGPGPRVLRLAVPAGLCHDETRTGPHPRADRHLGDTMPPTPTWTMLRLMFHQTIVRKRPDLFDWEVSMQQGAGGPRGRG